MDLLNRIDIMVDEIVEKYVTEEKVIKTNAGDIIVIHTSFAYDKPQITQLKSSEIKGYFSEDNGFDEKNLKEVMKMKSNDHKTIGDGPDSVVVVKI